MMLTLNSERIVDTGRERNFKSLFYSPDGNLLLAVNEDQTSTVYTANNKSIYQSPSSINDVVWYPWSKSDVPNSSCYIVSSCDQPLKLIDAFDSKVRAHYLPVNEKEELDKTLCCCFSPDGSILFGGSMERIYAFKTQNSGPNYDCIRTREDRKSKCGQKGLLSSLCHRWDDTGVLAAGSFNGQIGIYDVRSSNSCVLLINTEAAITQMCFDRNGLDLFAAHRQKDLITQWDLRSGDKADFDINRGGQTNQRLYFSMSTDGSTIMTGSSLESEVIKYDLMEGTTTVMKTDHSDIISAISCHPTDTFIFASCSGQRHYDTDYAHDNSVRVYRLGRASSLQ